MNSPFAVQDAASAAAVVALRPLTPVLKPKRRPLRTAHVRHSISRPKKSQSPPVAVPAPVSAPKPQLLTWVDQPLQLILRNLFSESVTGNTMVVDSDPARFCLLELHRAVILGQDPDRWHRWWHGDPRRWLDEVINGPFLSKAASHYWRCHQARLRRGLAAVTPPAPTDAVQRLLMHALLMPRRQTGRLLGLSDKVRRSGRFLVLCGRRRRWRTVSLWLATAIIRFADPLRRTRTWPGAMRLGRQWQGRLTSALLACDPAEDERLQRWFALPLAVAPPDTDRLTPGQIRTNWENTTLLPRNTPAPAPAELSFWQGMDVD